MRLNAAGGRQTEQKRLLQVRPIEGVREVKRIAAGRGESRVQVLRLLLGVVSLWLRRQIGQQIAFLTHLTVIDDEHLLIETTPEILSCRNKEVKNSIQLVCCQFAFTPNYLLVHFIIISFERLKSRNSYNTLNLPNLLKIEPRLTVQFKVLNCLTDLICDCGAELNNLIVRINGVVKALHVNLLIDIGRFFILLI